jgi:hypothetical protein
LPEIITAASASGRGLIREWRCAVGTCAQAEHVFYPAQAGPAHQQHGAREQGEGDSRAPWTQDVQKRSGRQRAQQHPTEPRRLEGNEGPAK